VEVCVVFFLLLVLACGDKDADDTAGTPTDGGSADGGTTGATCVALSTGDDWAFNGQCPQMRTPCDIVVDGCSLAIDYEADGGMTMGMPYAGTIAGDTITFEDGDYVKGCVGTIADPDTVSGTCDGGCTFTLER
jgi:hypothetical protein